MGFIVSRNIRDIRHLVKTLVKQESDPALSLNFFI